MSPYYIEHYQPFQRSADHILQFFQTGLLDWKQLEKVKFIK